MSATEKTYNVHLTNEEQPIQVKGFRLGIMPNGFVTVTDQNSESVFLAHPDNVKYITEFKEPDFGFEEPNKNIN